MLHYSVKSFEIGPHTIAQNVLLSRFMDMSNAYIFWPLGTPFKGVALHILSATYY